jgi:hypothetical protein
MPESSCPRRRIDPVARDRIFTISSLVLVGGGLLLAMFLGGLFGCAVGFGEPDTPGGTAPVVWGLNLGQAASSANDFFSSLFEGIGGWLGVGGLGTGGVLVGGLVRAWSARRAQAAAAEALRAGERAGWDEAAAETDRRTAARDSDFYEAIALANGGVGPALADGRRPATGEVNS